jgi:ABC-type branched-subunit amino acid transport system substrate-binding protein
VGVVGAQFVYFNIQAQLFGSGEWNDEAALHEHKRYTSGLIFESDTYIDTSSATYREFASAFSARFRKYPSKNALFGFDTAQLLLHLIRNGAATRPALARALARTRDFQGIHSPIGFSEGRVNSWLSILKYDGTGVSRIGLMGLFPSEPGGEAKSQ